MSEKVDALCTELSLAVLSAEASLRNERRREVLMRMAAFPSVKTLEQVDFEAAAGVPKARIQELAGLAFTQRRENVIFVGPSGTGKSHLATAFGVRATAVQGPLRHRRRSGAAAREGASRASLRPVSQARHPGSQLIDFG